MPRAAELLAALAALILAWPAQAQYLYKWVDAEGRTQYSDRPPKGFTGPVTRIEQDPEPPPPPAPRAQPATGARAPVALPDRETPAPPDRATQRRITRDALAARLAQAREALAQAKKALDEAPGPEPDERQVVQQVQSPDKGGMFGLSQQRSNCQPVTGKDGKTVSMCPALLPNESYFDRMARLEAAVKRAEQEVDDAEQAYRRGVD